MTEGWTAIMPECIIPCCDLWPPGSLSPAKMKAYKALADEKRIARLRVVYDKASRYTSVEYMGSLPHEWMLTALREKAVEILNSEKAKQEKMEV